jgi:ElaB/YqjD/DUF883 family membrane-anchored ribosome-binding protein
MEGEMNRPAGSDTMQGRQPRDMSGVVNEASEVLKDYGSRKLEDAKQTWSHAQTAMTDGYHQAMDVTDQYVHANPWRAIGIAAAAGMLLGLMLARR